MSANGEKRVFIETLGCQMNVRDSEHMIAELNQKENYTLTDSAKDADLIMINTCSVREKPVKKLFSEIGQFNKIKKPGAKIGVCGCTASHLGKDIIKKAPAVDFVLGARNVSKISEVIHKKGAVEIDTDNDESTYSFAEYRTSKYKSFVNISIGCDKECTFCIVPATRGKEISIPTDLILKEIEKSVASGVKEVVLLGQNVNNYGRRFSGEHEKVDFTELLRRVSKIDGLERIRFTSPHPLHMDDEFIEEFASNPKICKSMHMPLQSGNSKVLKEMKRGYSKEGFLNRMKKLREMVPDVFISTDIIVGFPGESDEEFEDTLDVMTHSAFEQVFSFKYSARPHTEAESREDIVPSDIAGERLDRVIALNKSQLDERMPKEIGKVHKVLFDELGNEGHITGRTDNGFLVKVKGSEELLGEIVDVKITNSSRMSLQGEVI